MANILIIEKDPIAVRIMMTMLLSDNHHVAIVSNENEAIFHLFSQAIDLVIAGGDPGMLKDLELLGTLRKCQGCEDLPIVLYTDSGQQELIDEALGMGVNSILTKPFSSWELHRVVARTLDQPELEHCIYADEDCFCIESLHPENCPLKDAIITQDVLRSEITNEP